MQQQKNMIPFVVLIAIIIPAIILKLSFGTREVPLKGTEVNDGELMTDVTQSAIEQTKGESADEILIQVCMEDDRIEKMDLETYLVCVLLEEMPASFEFEALKAQAVVARTYALRQQLLGNKHDTADVCVLSSCCQGYCSTEAYLARYEDEALLKRVEQAVNETKGQVLTYNGELIEATYFSCSGGKTEDAEAVWGADVPYLQSVESPGEEIASCFVDTVQIPLDTFCKKLEIDNPTSVKNFLGAISYTAGGGVDTIEISGRILDGTSVRMKLGLRSTAFAISVVGSTVTITTKGYGHRVGMSQYGAEVMAVKGFTYSEILMHYYQGVEIRDDFL